MFSMTLDRDRFLARRLVGPVRIMEVGVREGELARFLLENTEAIVHGVDVAVRPSVRALEKEFPGRYQVREARSPAASSLFEDGLFDAIYVDADHSRDAVAADLEAWWPKLRPGGLFCGDDYADVVNPSEGAYGVVEAVEAFADRHGLMVKVAGAKREERRSHAALQGERATAYLHGRGPMNFQNPLWYFWKERP